MLKIVGMVCHETPPVNEYTRFLFDISFHSRGTYFKFEEQEPLPREAKRKWLSRCFHYDNVATAMLTLFAVQTGEGWPQ